MNKENKLELSFALNQIKVEDFNYNNQFLVSGKIDLNSTKVTLFCNFGFINFKESIILCSAHFRYLHTQHRPNGFLESKIICSFFIEPKTWKSLINEEDNALIIPNHFAVHLASLTIGTLRGAIYMELKDKPEYKQLLLPLINAADVVGDTDIVISNE